MHLGIEQVAFVDWLTWLFCAVGAFGLYVAMLCAVTRTETIDSVALKLRHTRVLLWRLWIVGITLAGIVTCIRFMAGLDPLGRSFVDISVASVVLVSVGWLIWVLVLHIQLHIIVRRMWRARMTVRDANVALIVKQKIDHWALLHRMLALVTRVPIRQAISEIFGAQ